MPPDSELPQFFGAPSLSPRVAPQPGTQSRHARALETHVLLAPLVAFTRTRNWLPASIQILLAIGLFASLGVTLVILIQDIHPAPDKLTLQKDASELASTRPRAVSKVLG